MQKYVKTFEQFVNEQFKSGNDLLKEFKKYGFELDRNIDGVYLDVNPATLFIRHADENEEITDTTLVIELGDNTVILTGENKIKKVLEDGLIDKIKDYSSNPSKLDSFLSKQGFKEA